MSPRRDGFLMRMGLRSFENAQHRPLMASGEKVNLDDVNAINAVLNRRQRWQIQALDANDACPEVNYGIEFLSGICSRVTLYAATMPSEKDAAPIRTGNSDAISNVEQLGSFVERAEIQRDMATQLLITGEPYLIGQRESSDERWSIASVEEVHPDGDTVRITDSPFDESPERLDPRNSTWIRMWRRSPRYRSLATSHIKPLLETIDELLGWDAAARAAGRNRLTMAGLLGIPSDCEVPAEEDDPPEFSGSERFVRRVFNAMVTAIRNPSSAAAAVPIVFSYTAKDSGKSGVEFISVDRPQDALLESRTERCLGRLGSGLNVPPEVLTGLGGATHGASGSIKDSAFREHGEPLVILMCNALTIAYHRPRLIKAGMSPEEAKKEFLWFDKSKLIERPDMGQAADRGAELLMIGPAAWRRERGFSETDAPTPTEEKRMIEILTITRGRGGSNSPDPLNPTKPDAPQDPERATGENAPDDHPPRGRRANDSPAVTNRGKGQQLLSSADLALNGHTNGSALLFPEQALAIRLQMFGDMTIRRALERAGNLLRSLANPQQKSSIKSVPSDRVALTLGREVVNKLDKRNALFEGSFDAVPSFYVDMVVKTWAQLSSEAPPRDTIRTAASNFTKLLRERAAELLFEPPGLDPVVEGPDILQSFMFLEMI